MVGVAAAVHFDVGRVCREFALVFFAKVKGVTRFGQQPVEELDVRRVKIMVELVKARMRYHHHAPFPQQRLVPVHIKVVPERHHLHQQRVQGRIDVVRRDVWDA